MSTSLPPNANLTQLKHQAKDLLKAHKRGDPSCCSVLRQLRQFADVSDADILAATVRLDDAQFALAMHYGFESWPALKKHVSEVSGGKAMSAVVFGCVTAEDGGQPIEDAEVRLQLKDGSEIPVAYACVRTASNGRYECTLKWTGAEGPELWSQCKHAAYAYTDGKETEPGEGHHRLLRMRDGQRYELDIALREGYTLELAVEDEDGIPVTDADVRIGADGPMSGREVKDQLPDSDGHVGSPRTDAHGYCRVEGIPTDLPPNYTRIVDIDHPRFGIQRVLTGVEKLPRDGCVARAHVQLRRRFSLTGRVVCAETDQPIEGARLFVAAFADDLAPEEAGDAEKNSCNIAFSGPDGQFEVPGLADRPHRVFITHGEWVGVEAMLVVIPQSEPLVIRMERGRTISGEVIDRTGKLIPGARIAAISAGGREQDQNETRVDESGHFKIGGLPTDRRVWLAAKNEGRDEVYGFREIGPDEHDVVLDGRKMVEVEGVVVDEVDQPVPIRILCTVYGGTERGGVYLARSAPLDDCGAFRALVPPDGSIAFRLDSREDEMQSPFHNIEHVTMCDGRADRPLRFVANPSKELALRLVDATTDEPVWRAELSMCTTSYWNWCFMGMSDEDGRAAFSTLPPCDVNVRVVATGYEELSSERIALPTDEEIVIHLTPKD